MRVALALASQTSTRVYATGCPHQAPRPGKGYVSWTTHIRYYLDIDDDAYVRQLARLRLTDRQVGVIAHACFGVNAIARANITDEQARVSIHACFRAIAAARANVTDEQANLPSHCNFANFPSFEGVRYRLHTPGQTHLARAADQLFAFLLGDSETKCKCADSLK